MLAKIWKKLLLAICIIACLFNITYKLVNRVSLEKVISGQPEGVNVRNLLNITEDSKVVMDKSSYYNNVTNTTVTNNTENSEQVNPEEEQQVENSEENVEQNPEDNPEETQEPEENKSMTVTDFIDRVIDGSFKY